MQQGADELKVLLFATNQTLQFNQLRMPGSTTYACMEDREFMLVERLESDWTTGQGSGVATADALLRFRREKSNEYAVDIMIEVEAWLLAVTMSEIPL
ncbi:hypothetical protein TNCT_107871 [Trichonephila clavata]|uniref:Uncharacterized protein n=1 Tax=Trichonephila clavata TaxID=2740835 RepID=A0A8X6HRK4_TRICU|nr:hypothetical protein TNCT_107871 [Trichonephila clavata]